MHHCKYILLIISLFYVFSLKGEKLQTGDLIFQTEGSGEFSQAISSSTAAGDSLKFVHVGIIEVNEEGKTTVIEASPEDGVRIVTLEEFLISPTRYVVKRLNMDFPVTETIKRAKSYLGQPYDWWYLQDNGKMYCSELVFCTFLNENGDNIFKSQPMNFRNPDGSMPEFWTKLFEELGESVPEGMEGTNPSDLSKDPRLITIAIF